MRKFLNAIFEPYAYLTLNLTLSRDKIPLKTKKLLLRVVKYRFELVDLEKKDLLHRVEVKAHSPRSLVF